MTPDQSPHRSESLSRLAACLAVMWLVFPVFGAMMVTRSAEWALLLPVGALVGAGYGKICERRIIRETVDRWIASVQHDFPTMP